jgi:purine-binding chemotaxis protein CheW
VTTTVVRVELGGESYALPVEQVLEVTPFEEVAPVPGASPALLGVRNLRGQVLPVVDLGGLLELPSAGRGRIVVTEAGGRRAGLAVGSVAGVESLPEAREPADSPYLRGAALVDGQLVGMLELELVLDSVQAAAAA